jgi:ketopantoate reductase
MTVTDADRAQAAKLLAQPPGYRGANHTAAVAAAVAAALAEARAEAERDRDFWRLEAEDRGKVLRRIRALLYPGREGHIRQQELRQALDQDTRPEQATEADRLRADVLALAEQLDRLSGDAGEGSYAEGALADSADRLRLLYPLAGNQP